MDKPLPTLPLLGAVVPVAGQDNLAGPRTRLRRHPERGSHAVADVAAIIDEAPICQLAFVVDGRAMALPTAHVRIDDQLYVHGALANRMLRSLLAAGQASATFTLLDGYVLARTAFHHSMNFRSAVVFGPISEVVDPDEKRLAFGALIEHMVPGRLRELAAPSDAELNLTLLLRLSIEEASAKTRSGPPLDAQADYALDIWAGEVPVALRAKLPVRDPALRSEQRISPAAVARAAVHNYEVRELAHGEYLLSNDPVRLQVPFIWQFLAQDSYWAQGISQQALEHAIEHSFCFGLYQAEAQVGFARVVSDRARFAYLADVFVRSDQRGRGLGRALIAFVLGQPELRDVHRFVLGTRDAQRFYEPFGWQQTPPERYMVRVRG
jgi:nitroimidazol reductase NimA-like FMN-containing flavoprotein (pyridoxamine 5'-phosphate oxidase superfamily)